MLIYENKSFDFKLINQNDLKSMIKIKRYLSQE